MKHPLLILLFVFCVFSIKNEAAEAKSQEALRAHYEYYCATPSDINEHISVLRYLANDCSSVIEIGVRSIISTWGILYGLSENPAIVRSYLGIDLNSPTIESLKEAKELALLNQISFNFILANDMHLQIPETELLFIDSLHTYCHLTYELETFSPHVTKYIALHDTSPPWENQDDTEYTGNYSEYPASINRKKRGLWPAVQDFLKRHPEWTLAERRLNNHGFTVLKRIH